MEGRKRTGPSVDQTRIPAWQRDKGWLDRTIESLEDAPVNLFTRKSVVTQSQRRRMWQTGIDAKATILSAPGENRVRPNGEVTAPYKVRVEVPGRAPYEVKSSQAVTLGAWRRMPEGAVVDALVDPDKPKRVLLLPPATEDPSV